MTVLKLFLRIGVLVSLSAVSALAELPAGFDLGAPLPVDPAVRVGELENGLRFYVKENREPAGRASLRLVVNAGSLQEEDNQRGLAHFLEHMAFNGTRHFEKMELVNFLERIGMRFGQHLNASTSFDQTLYQLEVPWDDEGVVDKAFLILEDWASGITLDPEEVHRERGIIEEEWRSGQGAGQRVRDKQYPLIYFKSHYANRLPIGSMVVVKNAPAERLVDFYRNWYRPNLMAVIAVGDFDGAEVEREIRRRFSDLKNPEGAPERLTYPVPDHEETLFSIVTDPELTGTSAQVILKVDPDPDATGADYRRHMVQRIYLSLVNQRLTERALEAEPPYLSAGVGQTKLGREKGAYTMSVNLIEGKELAGLEAMAAEVARASRDGFSQSELDREIASTLRFYDRIYEERDKSPSSTFASEFTRAFLEGEPIPGIELERAMARAFLSDLELAEVNEVGKVFASDRNRVILFTAPEKEGVALPEKEALLGAIEAGRATELEGYVDQVSDAPLMEELPTPGTIASESYREDVGVYDWTLSNGARVIVKPTDFKNDQILMTAFSEGGTSLVMDDELVSAMTATMVLGESGIGPFSAIELEKKLAGMALSLSPAIGDNSEGLSGSTSPKDLEVFFKLLHLQVTAPNEENLAKAFQSVKARVSANIANRQNSPQAVFQDAISAKLFGDHPRHRPLSMELLDEMEPGLSLEVFRDRFQNAGDFTFVFVGAIEIESFRELVGRYVASLPTKGGEREAARFRGDKPATGQQSVVVRMGLEEKSTIRVLFHGDAEWSPEARYALSFARGVLNIRLREVLREENSGVYGVGVFGSLNREPYGSYSSGFGFSCDPGNAELLVRLALNEIAGLQQIGPRPEDVQKVKELHLREHEKGLRENSFWLNNLAGMAREGRDFAEALSFPDRVRAFDPAEARRAAQLYFNMENMLIASLQPKYGE